MANRLTIKAQLRLVKRMQEWAADENEPFSSRQDMAQYLSTDELAVTPANVKTLMSMAEELHGIPESRFIVSYRSKGIARSAQLEQRVDGLCQRVADLERVIAEIEAVTTMMSRRNGHATVE